MDPEMRLNRGDDAEAQGRLAVLAGSAGAELSLSLLDRGQQPPRDSEASAGKSKSGA
jgi:hypothetical protein